MLYTTDANDSLKSFNLLNISDAFGIARKNGNSESYYLYTEDLRGSTVNVLDNSASKVVSYWYNDFGEVTESKTSGYTGFDNELQYTGAVHDTSTGLLYLNARFYDPQTGRFISRDTYRGERDKASTWYLYLYLYCANNPVNYVDPSGHYVISIGFKAEAAAIVGGYGLISVNTDGKYLTICTSIGGKIITNAAANLSIFAIYYSHKTINGILGWGFSTGISFCFLLKLNGSIGVDIGSNGKMTYHGGGGGGAGIGFPVPYWDTEFGYTKQRKKGN